MLPANLKKASRMILLFYYSTRITAGVGADDEELEKRRRGKQRRADFINVTAEKG